MKQTLKNDQKKLIFSLILAQICFVGFTSTQFKEKLMNQTWENSKKSNPGPDFGLFGPNLCPPPPPSFLQVLLLLVTRHCSKLSSYAISRQTNEPNLRKWGTKTNFGPNFGLFWPKLGRQRFFLWFHLY